MALYQPPWGASLVGVGRSSPIYDRTTVLARLTPARHGAGFWAALWCFAVAAEVAALAPVIAGSTPTLPAYDVVYRLIGGSFTACGLIAWRRRPDSRSGPLLAATGLAFFVFPVLSQVHSPVAQTGALLLAKVWLVAFAALLLTLTTGGRLRSWVDRGLVAAFAVGMLVLHFGWLLITDIPGNVLLVRGMPEAAGTLDVAERWVVLAACIGTAVVVGRRFLAASRPARRALTPAVAGALTLLAFAAQIADGLLHPLHPTTALVWLSVCSLLAVPVVFLTGLLRSRLARAGLADLFRQLPEMRGTQLQAALSRSVDDPGLVVAFRRAEGDGFADADGQDIGLPVGDDQRALPIRHGGDDVAVLIYDAALDEDPELLEIMHAAASVAVENQHLQAESARGLAELKASRERLVAAADAERQRLERNLHDGAQQRLVVLRLQLGEIRHEMSADPALERLMSSAMDELARSLDELRALAHGLHPAVLDHGLAAALESVTARSPVSTELSCASDERLPESVELAIYFVVSEALANVAKHARASRAAVRFSRDTRVARVEVVDNGIGGAVDPHDTSVTTGGTGLRGLADRIEALDGRLLVRSSSGAGTQVLAELPLAR